MGKTKYHKIRDMLDKLKEIHGDVVNSEILTNQILMDIGSDSRALKGTLSLMKQLNMYEDLDGDRTRLK